MDRDQRWERVELAYAALTEGRGLTALSAAEAVSDGYESGENDEFVKPRVILRAASLRG
jgi:2,3-bisphosphoglycerate-independent phosphoglycerate mutase